MQTIRAPAVAGMFYPARPDALESTVADYLGAVQATNGPGIPKGVIVPHAGYVYSGAVAASAYAELMASADRIRRVVLLGPAHRVAFRGVAAPEASQFETPLGRVPVEQSAIQSLVDDGLVFRWDRPHAPEHSLEVQLPFLQATLGSFDLVPLLVGDTTADHVADVVNRLWGGPETLIVVSSDLSHYLPYDAARRVDDGTTRAIEALRDDVIGFDEACGALPVRGLLRAARGHGLRSRTVDVRNSGDTAGPRDRVVGYGAYVFTDA